MLFSKRARKLASKTCNFINIASTSLCGVLVFRSDLALIFLVFRGSLQSRAMRLKVEAEFFEVHGYTSQFLSRDEKCEVYRVRRKIFETHGYTSQFLSFDERSEVYPLRQKFFDVHGYTVERAEPGEFCEVHGVHAENFRGKFV